MKLTLKIILSLTVIYCCSCSGRSSVPQKQDSLRSLNSMAGKLYFFAPEFDSTNLEAIGECDCCAANTLFLNDSSFLEIEYCDEGSTYVMGKYRTDSQTLTLSYDSVNVNSYLPDVEDTAHMNFYKVAYHVSIEKAETKTYQKKAFKGVNLFLSKDVGAPDKVSKYNDLLKVIHDEGIWEKLHTDPASIPRNSPLIGVYLQGIWMRSGDTTASFKIMEDSIYYFANRQIHPYKLNHDSLRIILAQKNELIFPIKIPGADTLIFEGPERQVYYRFNKYP